LMAVTLDLEPGDTLYTKGTVARYAYIVESGLLQCQEPRQIGQDLPSLVHFASVGDLLGVYEHATRRPESVEAVTASQLIALPLDGLHHMQAAWPVLDELVSRQLSVAMKRNWRVAYSLRDLAPWPRTISALLHLNDMVHKGKGATLDVMNLDIGVLSDWLSLPIGELKTCLAQLESMNVIEVKAQQIVLLRSQALLDAAMTLRQSRQQATAGHQRVPSWVQQSPIDLDGADF